jgi:hypothetical protein
MMRSEKSTLRISMIVNNPPDKPKISGPFLGKVGEDYEFVFSTKDPEGDRVYYYIDWGGDQIEWIGPYDSGEEVSLYHSWNSPDLYKIRAKAKDEFDCESDWSTFIVVIPKRYSRFGFSEQSILMT